MPRLKLLRLVLLLSPLAAAGCDLDPFERPELWNPTGANEANLAAMVDDPMDLVRGRGEAGAEGNRAAAAVARLRRDHVKELPSGDTTGGMVGGGSGSGGGGGGAPAAGSGP